MFDGILSKLTQYESEDRALRAPIVHGDPVFSNVLLCKDGAVKLIDMRGAQGSQLALEGDAVYDLAKVYQSLVGYDYIILDRAQSKRDAEYINHLTVGYWAAVNDLYGSRVRPSDVKLVTASHFFSLLPLHENIVHRQQLLGLCESLYRDV